MLAVQASNGESECSLESGDAEGGALKLHLLFVQCVRRVIGCDRVHSAVGQGDEYGFVIRGRAQWRIHLEVAVVLANRLVSQGEVMGRDLAGDAGLAALAAAHGFERVGGREMRHMQARARELLR